MNVGLYFDLRNPPQWPRDPHELYSSTLDLCEEVDGRGIHSLWFTEHHQFEDAYLPQPLTYLAAVAARTKRVRLGTSIVVAPLHSAVTLAEQCAVVDIISDGRLELGLGAGYLIQEFELYGVPENFEQRGKVTVERALEILRLCTEGGITPVPIQTPLPISVGASFPSTARRVGRAGLGLQRVDRHLVEPYLEGLVEGGHGVEAGRMSGPANIVLSEDPERDWPYVREHVGYQWDSYARQRAMRTDEVFTPIDPDAWLERGLSKGAMAGFVLATPEDASKLIQSEFTGAPAETIYLWGTLPGLSQELARRNIDLICDRLVPALAGV